MPCRCLGRSNSYREVFPCRLPEEKSAACYPHCCRSRSNYRHLPLRESRFLRRRLNFGKLPVEERDHAEGRSIMKGKLVTGESVEVHESTLPPNGFPHAPHHRAHSEIWLIREGTLQLTINGTPPVLGPGGLGFVRSNEEHGIRVGTTTANYYVVAIGPGADTKA
jgi:mannose-6-phosphate isomerase-like protein (cupin superfamily)